MESRFSVDTEGDEVAVLTARPESTESTIEISKIEKAFPAPPRSKFNIRKTLPPLPPLSEIEEEAEKDASVTTAAKSISTAPPKTPKTPTNVFDVLSPTRLSHWGTELQSTLQKTLRIERPPEPISKDPPRTVTTTAYTKRSSISTYATTRRIKYGTGKHTQTELSPQPSEDPEDPLNWPLWKKNLNFVALLSMVALIGVMKTAYVSVNNVVAVEGGVSYVKAAALTAIPLMLDAVTGLASLIISRIWGKRPVYLASTASIFIGVVWNTQVRAAFGQNVGARVFQGLGWGAFDTLVLGSIQDTYFEHERQSRIVAYQAVSITTIWGSPLLGGVVSSHGMGFTLQFKVIGAFLAASILLIVLGAPETCFERSTYDQHQTPAYNRSPSLWPKMTFSRYAAFAYLRQMKPQSYRARFITSALLKQAPRAMVAPSTLVLFVTTFLPHVGLWGLASSLSLLFSSVPFSLSQRSIGLLMAGPFLFATGVAVGMAFLFVEPRFKRSIHLTTLLLGSALAVMGIIGFGVYVDGFMLVSRPAADAFPRQGWNVASPLWNFDAVRNGRLNFPVASFLLGLLAAGSLALDATARPVIQRSTAFTSANLFVGLRNTADMYGGLTCLRNLVAGAFVLGISSETSMWDGLKLVSLGLGIGQVFITAWICALWWYRHEQIRRLDGRVMGLVDLSILKEGGSFFDLD